MYRSAMAKSNSIVRSRPATQRFRSWRSCSRFLLGGIELSIHDHGFADLAGATEALGFLSGCINRQLLEQALKFFIEQLRDQLRCVFHGLTLLILDGHEFAMHHTLCNHQAMDAVGRKIFHIAIKQACSLAFQNSVAITDHGPGGRACSGQRGLADFPWNRASFIGCAMAVCIRLTVWSDFSTGE
jgi:hypothetical protein